MGSVMSLGLGGLENEVSMMMSCLWEEHKDIKVAEAEYSGWEMLGGSEEGAVGIFDVLGTQGHKKDGNGLTGKRSWTGFWNTLGGSI